MFIAIWKYQVKPQSLAAFEQLYGPEGKWVEFFKESPDFIRTDLLRLVPEENTYMTVDHWNSRASYEAHYNGHKATVDAIDAEGDALTTHEELQGYYGSL